jgi:Mrp family chromosome partitioning ATPase
MIVALLNQKGGVGKTTLALISPANRRARQRVTLIDADPQGSALDWSQQRSREGLPRRSASSAWRAIRSTAKRPSWRAMSITSSSTARRASPASCARRCSPPTSC